MPPSEHELRLRERLGRLRNMPLLGGAKLSGELDRLQRQLDRIGQQPSDEEIWRSVELARHEDRPYTLDYVERLFDDWFELHGDRSRADDGAMIAGLGKFDGRTVALVGQQKGRDTHERAKRQFGMPDPEGYRKAIRVMELADKHRFPIVSLVDTPGAYPGVAAEQHGQGGAIAASQAAMARLTVPTVACVIGEGGSGGAIAIALADRVLMMENAIYSVISPEGCAMILWRDAGEKRKAAAAFKPDAAHCLELGVIDGIVREPEGGAQTDPDAAARCSANRCATHSTISSTSRATSFATGGGPSSARSAFSRELAIGFCRFLQEARAGCPQRPQAYPRMLALLVNHPGTTRGRQMPAPRTTPRWVEKRFGACAPLDQSRFTRPADPNPLGSLALVRASSVSPVAWMAT